MKDKPFTIQVDLLLYFASLSEAESMAKEIKQLLEEDYIADYDKETVVLRRVEEQK